MTDTTLTAEPTNELADELTTELTADSAGVGPASENLPSTQEMTITGRTASHEFGLVAVDLYRDIHKGIRSEMFATTVEAGRLDPSDREGRVALACQVHGLVDMLASHAQHEDTVIQPVLEQQLPVLAGLIEKDHVWLEDRMEDLNDMADAAVHAPTDELRPRLHHLYLELSSFTSAYLRHQDVEERVVMPSLEVAIGVPDVIALHEAIISSIPPEEMTTSLAMMLPTMNLDDRAELLGGMQAGAPPEVFSGVWSLVGSVLAPADHAALARRLGLY